MLSTYKSLAAAMTVSACTSWVGCQAPTEPSALHDSGTIPSGSGPVNGNGNAGAALTCTGAPVGDTVNVKKCLAQGKFFDRLAKTTECTTLGIADIGCTLADLKTNKVMNDVELKALDGFLNDTSENGLSGFVLDQLLSCDANVPSAASHPLCVDALAKNKDALEQSAAKDKRVVRLFFVKEQTPGVLRVKALNFVPSK